VAIALAAATEARITGVDISDAMLERGRERVRTADLSERIHLEPARAEALPFPSASFDAVSFTYLLRYVADPTATLGELARVLRPGGHMASLDFYVPQNAVWLAPWWAYTRMLLPAAGMLLGGKAWWDVGRFLGPNIEAHYKRWPPSGIVDAWEAAGMVDVGCRVMSLGGGIVMWGTKGA
jgi:demethylmenaquinone methyltransferase/2-methoxy-6-polyprenyl-1,4-benzoquinol methylase